jgi:hypothetical protein
MRTSSPSRPAVLRRITGEFEQIFSSLAPLAASFADAVGGPAGDQPESLARLREAAFAVLDRHQGLVAGAGAVAAPDAVPGSRYWLQWWWTRSSGDPEALRVNLDPAAPDFFDYTGADWYQTPMRTAARHVAGPYVDYACTNEYALTVVVPVTVDGQFAGVAAADVLVSSFERRLLPALRTLSRPAVLLNAGGRVIASSSPEFASGMRVPVPESRARRRPPIDWHLVPASSLD